MVVLALTNAEDLSAACRANAPCCRPAILHLYALWIPHFYLFAAFHTVCLHSYTPFFRGA
jgi:hypothetical protein